MKLVLVNPSYHEVYQNVSKAEGVYPPLGLASLAAYLIQHGHSVEIVDLNLNKGNIRDFVLNISHDVSVVGITSFTPTIGKSIEILEEIKLKNPHIITVIGGIHITATGTEALENTPSIDYGVFGEGEETLLELIDSLQYGRPQNIIKGLIYRAGVRIQKNESRPLIKDLDRLPFPAYSLLDISGYKLPLHHAGFNCDVPLKPFAVLFTSRGCPENCGFCASKVIWGRTIRFRSAINVVDEIEKLVKEFGVNVFDIADDNLTLNRKRLHEILDEIIRRKIKIKFNCLSRVDSINEEDLVKLKEAGCYLIRFGIESGSRKMLELMDKRIDLEKAVTIFKKARKIGIMTSASFVLGYLGDTKQYIKETIKYAKRLNSDLTQFFVAVPYPGTELYRKVKSSNLFTEDSQWDKFHALTRTSVIINKALNMDELISLRNQAYFKTYLNLRYILNCIASIRNINQIKNYLNAASALFSFASKRK